MLQTIASFNNALQEQRRNNNNFNIIFVGTAKRHLNIDKYRSRAEESIPEETE